jgi:hypothetical protein
MSDELVLTFAEIEFLLWSRRPELSVLELLRIKPEAIGETTAAAGLSSLLARGLCVMTDGKVRSGKEIAVVTTILTAADSAIDALGWVGDDMMFVHVFSSPDGALKLRPAGPGLFAVEAVDPGQPLSAGLVRFVDLCMTGGGESAVLLKKVTSTAESVSVAVARDAEGRWHLSDSILEPETSHQVTPEAAHARVVELFGADAVVVGTAR